MRAAWIQGSVGHKCIHMCVGLIDTGATCEDRDFKLIQTRVWTIIHSKAWRDQSWPWNVMRKALFAMYGHI